MRLALARQTRRIVGIAFGDRSEVTCRAMWQSLPPDDRTRALLSSDVWESYATVFAVETAASGRQRVRRNEPYRTVQQDAPPILCQSGAKDLVVQ